MRTTRLLGLASLSLILSVEGAAAADPFVKKATWEETMIASRARFVAGAEEAPLALGPWWMTGPWPVRGFDDALFPEQGIDLAAKGKDGRPLWQVRLDLPDGQVHMLPNGGRETTYLFRTITARRASKVEAGLGSDDGLELFLNGRKILSRNVLRGPGADQDHAVLDLVAGENRLLFKVHNNGGGHGFYFSIGSDPALPVWREIEAAFPREAARLRADAGGPPLGWFASAESIDLERSLIERALGQIGSAAGRLREDYETLRAGPAPADDPRWLALYSKCAEIRDRVRAAQAALELVDLEALGRAIDDLSRSFPDRYPNGKAFGARLDAIVEELAKADLGALDIERIEEIQAFQREVLLANPLLDFDRLLCVRRKANALGLPQNWQGNCAIGRTGYDNEIAVLSPVGPHGSLATLYRPEGGRFVGDVDLHFDAGRMLVSMPGSHNRWQIWEIRADGTEPRQVTPGEEPDVDNYDACYLPDERIIFASTRCFQGVPCVGGGNTVANFCIMNPDGTEIRQICFDQDHNWCPTLLNDGRVLYSRWEYSDTPHYFSRLLFSMNPDGTNQLEYYASNSMWPNSIFYARPIPNHPTMVVAVISGHHGVPRMGELLLFDPALGRREANGAVQRIPGYGKKVEPIIRDTLVDGSWPKFLHPFPLSEKYFLVSCKPTPQADWGLYLVDVFDNMLLLKEEPGYALFEPVPFRKTTRPPVIPDRVRPDSREAVVFLADVYQGPGLAGVPRGTVKKLRIYEPHYAYPRVGGHIHIGIDGPWDVHVIHGTVPVEADGSALFKVPANTPLAVQPLDADGRAL
ncbi:MAG: hypothetical protein JXP34_02760, partial [Planctomycetes bacterium]|nr:hypothetical protein [Planctomycetota bacterium]